MFHNLAHRIGKFDFRRKAVAESPSRLPFDQGARVGKDRSSLARSTVTMFQRSSNMNIVHGTSKRRRKRLDRNVRSRFTRLRNFWSYKECPRIQIQKKKKRTDSPRTFELSLHDLHDSLLNNLRLFGENDREREPTFFEVPRDVSALSFSRTAVDRLPSLTFCLVPPAPKVHDLLSAGHPSVDWQRFRIPSHSLNGLEEMASGKDTIDQDKIRQETNEACGNGDR